MYNIEPMPDEREYILAADLQAAMHNTSGHARRTARPKEYYRDYYTKREPFATREQWRIAMAICFKRLEAAKGRM